MNTELITAVSTNSSETMAMTSREIAKLTGKRHDNVLRDIKLMLTDLGEDPLKFEDIYLDAYGRQQKGYKLPQVETITLIAGYSVKLSVVE